MPSYTVSLVIVVLACVLACGRSAPSQSPAAPATEASEPGTSIEEATDEQQAPAPTPAAGGDALRSEDELSQAEQALVDADAELEALADRHREQEPLGAGAKPKKESASRDADACSTTCKALASLARARNSICRIDGARGERCERANAIVDKHVGSRQSCGCSD
jgi:hypothetical protein